MLHRDIKPENILIDEDFQPKLCDFGWTINLEKNESRQTFCGTYEYMAPEIFEGKAYDSSVDIWSLGILLYELAHGHSPFTGSSVFQIYKNITSQKLTCKESLHPNIASLIKRILKIKPDSRPTIDDIVNDKCLKETLPEVTFSKPTFSKFNLFSSKFHLKNPEILTINSNSDSKPTIPYVGNQDKDILTEDSLTAKRNFIKNQKETTKQTSKPAFLKKTLDERFKKNADLIKNGNDPTKNLYDTSLKETPQTPSAFDVLKDQLIAINKKVEFKRLNKKEQILSKHKFDNSSKIVITKESKQEIAPIESNNSDFKASEQSSSINYLDKKTTLQKKLVLLKHMGNYNEGESDSNYGFSDKGPNSLIDQKKVNNISLNQFSKNISIYMNSKKPRHSKLQTTTDIPMTVEFQNSQNVPIGASQNETNNSISQNNYSKNSASNFSYQQSKSHFQSYFSNKSNVVVDKVRSAAKNTNYKSIIEKMNARKIENEVLIENPQTKNSNLFKHMISYNLKKNYDKNVENSSVDEEEQKLIKDNSNLYANIGGKTKKIEDVKIEEPKVDLKFKVDSIFVRYKVESESTRKISDLKAKPSFASKRAIFVDSTKVIGKGASRFVNNDGDSKVYKTIASLMKK